MKINKTLIIIISIFYTRTSLVITKYLNNFAYNAAKNDYTY